MLSIVRLIHGLRRKLAEARRSTDGIAAVEFALILPVMLLLYFGSFEVTQAVRASRKTDLLASALANIASQQTLTRNSQQTACTDASNPCLNDNDMTGSNGIFYAAASILSPYWCDTSVSTGCSTTSILKMTVSQVNVTPNNGNLVANVDWSTTYNGGVARPCNGGGPNSSLLAGTVNASTAGYQNYLPANYTASGAPTGRMIVADIAFQYKPGFGYTMATWANSATTMKMSSIGYFRNRTTSAGSITPEMTANVTKCTYPGQ